MQAYRNATFRWLQGWRISYVVKDDRKWVVDPERTALEFNAAYYGGLLEKVWGEVAFVFR